MRDCNRIVNLSSGVSRFIAFVGTIYEPLKAVVEALTRYMAVELGRRRIAVNLVAPDPITIDFSCGTARDNLGAALRPEQMAWVNAQRIEVAGRIRL